MSELNEPHDPKRRIMLIGGSDEPIHQHYNRRPRWASGYAFLTDTAGQVIDTETYTMAALEHPVLRSRLGRLVRERYVTVLNVHHPHLIPVVHQLINSLRWRQRVRMRFLIVVIDPRLAHKFDMLSFRQRLRYRPWWGYRLLKWRLRRLERQTDWLLTSWDVDPDVNGAAHAFRLADAYRLQLARRHHPRKLWPEAG